MSLTIDFDDLTHKFETCGANIDPFFFTLLTIATYTLPIYIYGLGQGLFIDVCLTPFIFPLGLLLDTV
ncbi:uncharacterized protein K489DRAFT_376742, partial [Dissoconium aciculare CBS 342.82]|uniref:Uncharacterized protein n=1 Tax=Dissoconium aciculare CBS 342.82 TaxID=1314786 RepID=A0A6J3MEA3_9PEZI